MINADIEGLNKLINKEINSCNKLFKPDFSKQSGREEMADYLKSKFYLLSKYDQKSSNPIVISINDSFITNFLNRLISYPEKRIMIGITGESASGKSTICRAIQELIKSFNMPVTVLTTDNYFNDISSLIKKYGSFDVLRDNGYDIDSPESFQLETLKEDLTTLSKGADIYSPEYLPNGTGVSLPKSKYVKAQKVVIVEGIASMYESIKDIFDIKIYVEADTQTRKDRFLRRAYTERNQDLDNALKHWEYILGAGQKYVQPAKDIADIVLSGNADMEYVRQVVKYIHTVTNNFS